MPIQRLGDGHHISCAVRHHKASCIFGLPLWEQTGRIVFLGHLFPVRRNKTAVPQPAGTVRKYLLLYLGHLV